MPVPQRTKQEAIRDVIASAASNHNGSLTINLFPRFANRQDAISPREVKNVMGTPALYAEVLPEGPDTVDTRTSGAARRVDHAFSLFLVREYEDSSPYAGSTQEAFDQLTEGVSPDGVLTALRRLEGYTGTAEGKIHIQQPTEVSYDIVPLYQQGAKLTTAHQATATITARDFE